MKIEGNIMFIDNKYKLFMLFLLLLILIELNNSILALKIIK